MPGGGHGPLYLFFPKSLTPCTAWDGGLFPTISVRVGRMFHISQWVKLPAGASGSSTMSTRLFASSVPVDRQRRTHVLAFTSEAFWDVSPVAEIRAAKFHSVLRWNFRSARVGDQSQCKHQDWKQSFHRTSYPTIARIFLGGHHTNIYLLKASSSILVARHYFANPQHFSHLRNSPKKLMLSAPGRG